MKKFTIYSEFVFSPKVNIQTIYKVKQGNRR